MLLKGLDETADPTTTADADPAKNKQVYAELVQFLDKRSLSIIMRDAKDKGREAMDMLRNHYRGKGKQRIISLYTELTSLVKRQNESVTDYLLRAENASTALNDAGEKVSDGLLVAMVLKGLPSDFKSFVAVITQSDKTWTFRELKASLRDYEDTEKSRNEDSENSIMKANFQRQQSVIICHICGVQGHKSPQCPENPKNKKPKKSKKWCSHCKKNNHNTSECTKLNGNKSTASKSAADEEFHSFHFKVDDDNGDESESNDDEKSTVVSPSDESDAVNVCSDHKPSSDSEFLVDSGCSSHITNNDDSFVEIDQNFTPHEHSIELADGTKVKGVAEKRGSVKIQMVDSQGNSYDAILDNCLYIPSYPDNIFSVKAANRKGVSVFFYPERAEMVAPDKTIFPIDSRGSLFYLRNVTFVKGARDLKTWHQVLGHCNTNDILKLESIVDGMKISNKTKFHCEPCVLGKQTKHISKKPSKRSTKPLEFVSSDVCGPITPESHDGFRYVVSFVDNFTGFIFLYYCKLKSDVAKILERFLADVSPVGKVQNLLDISGVDTTKLRSDGGGEYMGKEFKNILIKNQIKHETSAPYSPHQNGVAERSWRTLFDMGRTILIGSGLPQELWPYALMASAYVRNRCYVERLSQTPYFMLTGRKPDVSKLQKFGTVCYSIEQKRKKLDPKSKRGIFVGYDKESPAFLVYCPDTKKVRRCRDVKFTDLFLSELDDNNQKENVPSVESKPKKQSNNKQNSQNQNQMKNQLFSYASDDDDFPGVVFTAPIQPRTDVEPDPGDGGENEAEITLNETVVLDEIPVDEDAVVEEIVVENVEAAGDGVLPEHSASGGNERPKRTSKLPSHLADYDLSTDDNVAACKLLRVLNSDDVVDVCKMTNDHVYTVPKTYNRAINSQDSSEWKQAMSDEYESLKENNTFDLVPLPEGKKLLNGRWVYAMKEGPDGEEIYKARFVAKGYSQTYGTDYFETFSPTAKMSSVRILMQLAAEFNLTVHQMDVKTAFLNAPIDCEIYVRQPEGFEVKGSEDVLVMKLNKSLYGLKQSGRNWNTLLHKFFVNAHFVQSNLDPCVYFLRVDENTIIVLVWVDDILLAASKYGLLLQIKNKLKSTFRMKDLGKMSVFLGMRFTQQPNYIEVDQTEYLKKILRRFDMIDCKPRSTPCEVNPAAFDSNNAERPLEDYRKIVGSLIYAMVCTRPDLSWVVTKLSQSLAKPSKGDWVIIKHVLQYIKGSLDKKLVYRKTADGLKLHGFSDSDWAGDTSDRRSTTGYCFMLNTSGPPVSWKSQKQSTVALSSCEAEYMALCDAVKEAKFLDMTMRDFVPEQSFHPVPVHVDNTGTISLGKNTMVTKRSKHIDIRYHFTRECYQNGQIDLVYVPTASNLADLFTKPMTKFKMDSFNAMLFGAGGGL